MTSVVFAGGEDRTAAVVGELSRSGVRLARAVPSTRTRFDTFDGRLHARGLRLELRTSAAPGELVLTGRGQHPTILALTSAPDPAGPLDPARLPNGPLTTRLREAVGPRTLLPQVTLRSRRRSGTLTDPSGPPRVSVHVDTDLAFGLGTESDARETGLPAVTVEVVELPGHARAAAMLRDRVGAVIAGGQDVTPAPGVAGDALELAMRSAGVDPAGWQRSAQPKLARKGPALVGVRAVMRRFADDLDANWQGTVDDLDPEFLHELRIAVRKNRSLLAQPMKVLPKAVREEQRRAYAWLGDITSQPRDLDVYLAGWEGLTSLVDAADAAALTGVRELLEAQRREAYLELTRQLTSPMAAEIRARTRAWLDVPDDGVDGGPAAGDRLGIVLAKRIRATHTEVVDVGRAIGDGAPAAALHELRKDAKRLSYLLYGFGHLGGRGRVKEVTRPLRALLDNLGAHQDAEVQAARLRGAMEVLERDADGAGTVVPPATRDAAVRLGIALDARKATQRELFASTFADFDRRRVRRALDEVVDRMRR